MGSTKLFHSESITETRKYNDKLRTVVGCKFQVNEYFKLFATFTALQKAAVGKLFPRWDASRQMPVCHRPAAS